MYENNVKAVIGLLMLIALTACEQEQQNTVPSRELRRAYVDGPHGQIHYRYVHPAESGKLPLLCLHPSPLSGVVYDNWLIEMGRDRYSLAPDTPGYGSSAAPPTPPEIADFATATIRFMDELGIERADVMGYHTGSLTSVELARSYPERIRKVVMISAPLFTETELAQYRKTLLGPPPDLVDMLARAVESLRAQPRGMFQDVPTDQRYWEISIERMRQFSTNSWGFRAAFNYDLTESLPEVEQPVLILNPEDDLWEQTPRAEPYLQNGRIHDLPGWTHGAMDGHTTEMARVVREFLDQEP